MPAKITHELAASLLPKRPADGHKGTFGHALLIAGSRGFSGAAKLCADGALRSGAGLVTVATPVSQQPIVAAGLLEAMSIVLPETDEQTLSEAAVGPALEAALARDAVGLGPGFTQHEATGKFLHAFVSGCTKPLLIDADGLNLLAKNIDTLKAREAETIVTPHPGEMARLIDGSTGDVQNDRAGVAEKFARDFGCVVVLKGAGTVIANPSGDVLINTTGNAGMGTGGTGDVLTGLITGLLAQGCAPFDAAALGVYVHGLAGDLAADAMTQRGMIAGDVIDCIPDAWAVLES
jgi:ADP-dependent NAD(P)H-hydrate dehydratase / NAD(P)H-hydrate epimerase